MSTVLSAMF